MATVPTYQTLPRHNGYPAGDGKPMAETDHHRDLMQDLIRTLMLFFLHVDRVYVSGNLLIFYEQGNKRRHISPDVFVVRGVVKGRRPNYLLWEEKPLNVVIELTSKTTRREDQGRQRTLYQDVLKVKEYFLFDPFEDWLEPSLQGFRLVRGVYRPIPLLNGRLPSRELGLHLERDGEALRLWNPATETWLPTPDERAESAEERVRLLEERLRSLGINPEA